MQVPHPRRTPGDRGHSSRDLPGAGTEREGGGPAGARRPGQGSLQRGPPPAVLPEESQVPTNALRGTEATPRTLLALMAVSAAQEATEKSSQTTKAGGRRGGCGVQGKTARTLPAQSPGHRPRPPPGGERGRGTGRRGWNTILLSVHPGIDQDPVCPWASPRRVQACGWHRVLSEHFAPAGTGGQDPELRTEKPLKPTFQREPER